VVVLVATVAGSQLQASKKVQGSHAAGSHAAPPSAYPAEDAQRGGPAGAEMPRAEAHGLDSVAARYAGAGAPLVEWQPVTVVAKVWLLLKGQVVVDRIRFEGLRAQLRRDAGGHGNWEI
jgi:hypothetical protein